MRVVLTVEGDVLLEVTNGDVPAAADFITTLQARRGQGAQKALPAGKGEGVTAKGPQRRRGAGKSRKPVKLANGKSLSPALHEAWHWIASMDTEITPDDLAKHLGIATTAAAARLGELYQRGWVYRPAKGRYVAMPEPGTHTTPEGAA